MGVASVARTNLNCLQVKVELHHRQPVYLRATQKDENLHYGQFRVANWTFRAVFRPLEETGANPHRHWENAQNTNGKVSGPGSIPVNLLAVLVQILFTATFVQHLNSSDFNNENNLINSSVN